MAPFALLIITGRRDPPLCVPSLDFFLVNGGSFFYFFLPSNQGSGGCHTCTHTVQPFETVPVVKGYTRAH